LKPENPAIMDSMGWVLFRLGKSQEALLFLAKAYEKYPDGEVAAHLGEVLLSVDQKEQAYALWKVALQRQPDHKILLATLARLAPELLNTTGEQGSEKADENAPTTDLLKANERTPLELQTPADTGDSDDSLTQEAPATQG
jgi:predicted Zn-dependent protease